MLNFFLMKVLKQFSLHRRLTNGNMNLTCLLSITGVKYLYKQFAVPEVNKCIILNIATHGTKEGELKLSKSVNAC